MAKIRRILMKSMISTLIISISSKDMKINALLKRNPYPSVSEIVLQEFKGSAYYIKFW